MDSYIILNSDNRALFVSDRNPFSNKEEISITYEKAIELAIENDITLVPLDCKLTFEQLNAINTKNILLAPSGGLSIDNIIHNKIHFMANICNGYIQTSRVAIGLTASETIEWLMHIDEDETAKRELKLLAYLIMQIVLNQNSKLSYVAIEATEYVTESSKLILRRLWTLPNSKYMDLDDNIGFNKVADIEETVNRAMDVICDGKVISELYTDRVKVYIEEDKV